MSMMHDLILKLWRTASCPQEIQFLKRLSGHQNIIQFISAASIGKEESDHGQAEFLLLTELCEGGQLVDVLNKATAGGVSIPRWET